MRLVHIYVSVRSPDQETQIITVPVLPRERFGGYLIGESPHFLTDSTVDTVCSDQEITMECLTVGGDDFHSAKQGGYCLHLCSSDDFLFVPEILVERG